ncbi:MAG: DinB family protein [Bacillaceae bacterium]|nr:DinB family protein [Bacillaceae bacterium]
MYGISEARQEIYEFVSRFSDETIKKKPDASTWSMLDNLEHLYYSEKLMTTLIKEALDKNERKRAEKEKPIHLTLDRTNKVDAPDFIQPKGTFASVEAAKASLDESRAALMALLQSCDESDLLENSVKHPFFGTMSVAQVVEFIGLHERRHLEQMREIEELLG